LQCEPKFALSRTFSHFSKAEFSTKVVVDSSVFANFPWSLGDFSQIHAFFAACLVVSSLAFGASQWMKTRL
jgi:hypothetical protein